MKGVRQRQRGSGSVLILLTALFFLTGLSRVGMGVVEALAQGTDVIAPSEIQPDAPDDTDPGDLFAALQTRAAEMQSREQELEARGVALLAAEAELRAQLDRLTEAEARLSETLHKTETAAENDLRHLTTVIENMKPAQASELFSQMDVEFAAGFVGRLRPEFAGEVMSALDPVIAYGISAVLAGRNARTPKN